MADTASLVEQACPRIAGIGGRFYFAPATVEVGREQGLDWFRFYLYGRGGVLGDVEPSVVGSAFGYFHPGFMDKMWSTARARTELTPRDAGRLFVRCAQEHGRRHLSELPGLPEFCAAADAVLAAADPAGLALFAALAAEPLADDPPARAMQLVTVLREFRGSAHLVALLATPGIDPPTAHAARRPEFWTLFGHPEDARPTVTDAHRAAMDQAERLTDDLVTPAYGVLDQQGSEALLDGLARIDEAIPQPQVPPAG